MTYEDKTRFIENYCSAPERVKACSNFMGYALNSFLTDSELSPDDFAVAAFVIIENLLRLVCADFPSERVFQLVLNGIYRECTACTIAKVREDAPYDA